MAFNLRDHYKPAVKPFDIFISMKRVEWDTLMFFYGVILCVGGLGALGYLALVSDFLYADLGVTVANVLIGVLSAVVDNIPLMFAVLSINPDMSVGQWLLITLTTGVGGSLLSIGSAAGVALMRQARGCYTFFPTSNGPGPSPSDTRPASGPLLAQCGVDVTTAQFARAKQVNLCDTLLFL